MKIIEFKFLEIKYFFEVSAKFDATAQNSVNVFLPNKDNEVLILVIVAM